MNNLKIVLGVLIALSASRFIPHPPNFTSLIALSFYVPVLFGIRYIPVVVISFVITDLIIGFHSNLFFTWGSVIIIGLISKPSKNKFSELIGSSYNVFPLDDWVYDSSYSHNKLLDHFKTKSLKGFGVDEIKLGTIAAGSIIHYLDDTEHNNLSHISNLQRIFPDSYVWMDKFTMKNLELFNSNANNGFNLSETIDDTITSMGSRKLKNWIAFPLIDKKEIIGRQEIVNSIINDDNISDTLDLNLSSISDVERLMSKIATYKISPRELVYLKNSLENVKVIKESKIKVKGNGEIYYLHIRNASARLPWHYYTASFQTSEKWKDITIPFDEFEKSATFMPRKLKADTIKTIGLVAYGKDHNADV